MRRRPSAALEPAAPVLALAAEALEHASRVSTTEAISLMGIAPCQ